MRRMRSFNCRRHKRTHESERHGIIIIDILASIHFIGVHRVHWSASAGISRITMRAIVYKDRNWTFNYRESIQNEVREHKTNGQQIIITYAYCLSKIKDLVVFLFPSHIEQFKCIIRNEECGRNKSDDKDDENTYRKWNNHWIYLRQNVENAHAARGMCLDL